MAERSKKGEMSAETSILPLRRSARRPAKTPQDGIQANPIVIKDPPLPAVPPISSIEADSVSSIAALPLTLPSKLPGLSRGGVKLLLYKQQRLQSSSSQIDQLGKYCSPESEGYEEAKKAVDATLVFAQEEAGTAVCISPTGLLLTCSHCIAETEAELDLDKIWWLLFSSGQVVQAVCKKWDGKRDIALLQIIAAQPSPSPSPSSSTSESLSFPSTSLSPHPPKTSTPLLCIGHPGSEDLEIGRPGVATGYDVLHISEGKFRGYAKGQDRQDNSEIGALKHDCWTYWGHSGAPLVVREGSKEIEAGRLVGVHSSWDEETGMRRGVGWEALGGFLGEEVEDGKTVIK